MKRLTNLLVVALLMLSFSVLVTSCKEGPKYYVSFVFTGDIENVTFNALVSELDNKGKVLKAYEFNNLTSGSRTKTYEAHDDAVKIQTDVTFTVNVPGYGEVKGDNGWSFTKPLLSDDGTTEITISITNIKIELDLKKNMKASAIIE